MLEHRIFSTKQRNAEVVSVRELTLAEIAAELTSQCVKIISRGSWVDNLHVAVLMLSSEILGPYRPTLAAQHEESLNSRGRVLRTLAVEAMGEGEYETGTVPHFVSAPLMMLSIMT